VLAVPSTLCGHCICRKGRSILALCLTAAAVTVKMCQLFLALVLHRKESNIFVLCLTAAAVTVKLRQLFLALFVV